MVSKVKVEPSESLSERVKVLENLIRQQQDFIDQTGEVWRELLKAEKADLPSAAASAGQKNKPTLIESGRAGDTDSATSAKQDAWKGGQSTARSRATQSSTVTAELKNLDGELAAQLASLDRIKSDLTAEQAKSAQLRAEKDELQQQITKGEIQADASQHQVKRMEDEIAKLENRLRQRQEEIEQTWSSLAEHRRKVIRLESDLQDARIREEALNQKLADANGWVLRLSGQRAESERQVSLITLDRDAKRRELENAQAQMQHLREQVDALTKENAALASRPIVAPTVVAPPAAPSLTGATPSPAATELVQIETLMQPVAARNKDELLRQLTGQPQTPTIISNFVEPPPPAAIPEAFFNLSTMPIVAQGDPEAEQRLREAEDQTAWLRELAVAALNPPNRKWWWRFMSLEWQMERERKRLLRKGLFDADAYLQRYPDVAESGMDPLQHYLKHGMSESRQR
ncbi:hypothetical protein [Sphingobium yanoikuyae]|uniref:hypothetical protein n=1 Tax=Sphingobium yanoikuyae TaxID=13690 RepID=UPI000262B9A8|nr:hypothetical protein [Sphingobium yanoikuyae]